jgi:hypothetical protein
MWFKKIFPGAGYDLLLAIFAKIFVLELINPQVQLYAEQYSSPEDELLKEGKRVHPKASRIAHAQRSFAGEGS